MKRECRKIQNAILMIRDDTLLTCENCSWPFVRIKCEEFSGVKNYFAPRARVRVLAGLSIHPELLINGRSSPRPRVSFVDNVT